MSSRDDMTPEDALASVLAGLDLDDLVLIADALDIIDPDDAAASRRSFELANRFRWLAEKSCFDSA